MSLREQAIKGVVWSALQQGGTHGINFVIFVILARLLEPEVFGLVALASVFTSFMQIFLEQSFIKALVQRPDIEEQHLDTAFWANIILAAILTGAGVIFSPSIANFLGDSRISLVITYLSFSLILGAFSGTQQAILQREMDFKGLAIRSLVAKLGGGIIGIVFALFDGGVWSLVANNLINGLLGSIVLWQVSDWRPKFNFSSNHLKDLFSFGIALSGQKTLVFFDTRFQDFLIGRFLGTTLLGYFTVAYRLQLTMITLLTAIFNSVTFPVFSKLQGKLKRLRNIFYQATYFTNLTTFPVFIGMALLAPGLLPMLFGNQWQNSISIMQILAVAGIAQADVYLKGNLIVALGKPTLNLIVRALSTMIKFLFLFFALRYWQSIFGVAVAFFISSIVAVPIYMRVSYSLIKFDLKIFFRQYVGPIVSTLAMAISVVLFKNIFIEREFTYLLLTIPIILGGFVYILTLLFIDPLFFEQIIKYARLIIVDGTEIKRRKSHES
jgi:PST family polysaccharide transporter